MSMFTCIHTMAMSDCRILLDRYMEMDIALYEKCSRDNNDKLRKQEAEKEAGANKWKAILDAAVASGIDINAL